MILFSRRTHQVLAGVWCLLMLFVLALGQSFPVAYLPTMQEVREMPVLRRACMAMVCLAVEFVAVFGPMFLCLFGLFWLSGRRAED